MSEQPPKRPARKPATRKPAAGGEPPKPRKARAKTGATRKPAAPRTRAPRQAAPASTGVARLAMLGLLCFIVLFGATWVYWGLFTRAELPAGGYKLRVERGSSYQEALARLEDDHVLPSAMLARLYLKISHPKPLHTGTYLFAKPLTVSQLLHRLGQGEGLIMTRITVIEGTTFRQLRALLDARDDVRHTLAGKTDAEVLTQLAVPEPHPEGLFAPDTYIFPPDEADLKILKRLYQQQQHILQQAWANRAPDLPYTTPYEALIMASIVEKETASKAERPQIAGVFVRRLQQGMRLQTDPTVIYGLGDSYNGNIRKTDLMAYTPYNTYRINGLPPTPIALPSAEAIRAALRPAPGNAVYFVARGDGSGTHVFSADLASHNQAVKAYLQARKGK